MPRWLEAAMGAYRTESEDEEIDLSKIKIHNRHSSAE